VIPIISVSAEVNNPLFAGFNISAKYSYWTDNDNIKNVYQFIYSFNY